MAVLLHVDMDAFFASAELLRHPEWRGKPLIVGSGPHERGVVSTCSYEARRFGVRSAMPSRTAYHLCPHAVFTPPDMAFYKTVSARVFEVFGRYSPFVEAVSVDEAFLDVTGTLHLHGTAERLGAALRREVRDTCGLTCSVGIAPNRLLAKIASEAHKPDGLTVMPFEPEAIAAYLAGKSLRILWGVGQKTLAALAPYRIDTCGDVQRTPLAHLTRILGSQTAAQALHDHAFGIASDTVLHEPADEKSVSHEHTFPVDVSDRATCRVQLLDLVRRVGRRFRTEERWARTAHLKLRLSDFRTLTRQAPFPAPSRDDASFRTAALELFDVAWPPQRLMPPVRLIGFGVTNLQNSPDREDGPLLFQTDDDERRRRNERLSSALDGLARKGISLPSLD